MPVDRGEECATAAAHRFRVRVYYEDTDAGGVVYHASYLRFAERARTEMLREKGFVQSQLSKDLGIFFVLRHCVADFVAPARLDDDLLVATRLVDLRGASLDLEQIIWRDRLALVRLRVKLACMSERGRAARFPGEVRAALAELSGNIWTDNGK